MGVKISIAGEEQVRIVPPAEDPADIRMRDRRKDPVGPASKRLKQMPVPAQKDVRAAYDELLRPVNRMSYYMDYSSWWGVQSRHSALLQLGEKELAKAGHWVEQLWAKYVAVMKSSKFEKRWGREPDVS